MLKLNAVTLSYNGVVALDSVDMNVENTEVVTIIGSNGAGKSSLLRCISGLEKVRNGSIFFEEQDITGWRADKIVGLGLVHCPEGRGILGRMTVRENLEMGAFRLGKNSDLKRDFEAVFSLFKRLDDRQKQLGQSLSGGEQQMLAIGRALMARPKLLMIDEMSLGLAPLLLSELFGTIGKLKDRGMTILLVEQNAMQALQRCDRAYVLERGRVTLEGSPDVFFHDKRVQQAYLGI
jgi:branched-chain amino acid transport system ATP-binding protein